jgi:aminoglycoside 3-N-acetyltransferase
MVVETIRAKDVFEGLRRLGVAPGDWVFFHTSLRSFGAEVEGGADGLIDALKASVYPGGTIAAPTHSDTSPGVFEPQSTPIATHMGVAPVALAARAGAVRSCHPSHSAAALGPDAWAWMERHEQCQAVGYGSPLHKLYRHPRGKALLIGVGLDRLTLLHLAESLARMPYIHVPWRTDMPRRFRVRPEGGQETWVDLRESPGCSDSFVKAEPALRAAGIIEETFVGASRLMLLPAAPAVDAAIALLQANPRLFLNAPTHCDWCRRANEQE